MAIQPDAASGARSALGSTRPLRLLDRGFPILGGVVAVALFLGVQQWCGSTGVHGIVADASYAARTRGWFTSSGFFPPELDRAADRQFSWSRSRIGFTVPRLARDRPHRFVITARA